MSLNTEDLIKTIIVWLELNGYEAETDETYENIIFYNQNEEVEIFCKINNCSLMKMIEEYGIDDLEIIE